MNQDGRDTSDISDGGSNGNPQRTPPFRDPALRRIWELVDAGGRLDEDASLHLFKTPDLVGLGWMARTVRRRTHGDAATFIVNQVVNPTNICLLRCRFCQFSVDPDSPDAFDLDLDTIIDNLSVERVSEVHIVGGLHPGREWEYYLELVALIREKLPRANIKAWTAVEIDHFARRFNLSVEDVLMRLKEAGLDMLPGGGAEIFSPRVRQQLCPGKPSAEEWLEIHRTAHELGILSNATMLYGHLETTEERVDHLLRLRRLQDRTHGFFSFIPLAFQPGDLGIVERRTPAVDDLRTIAASRLILDNVPHLKSYWVMTGESTTAVALHFGADDIDGTLSEEKIAHAAKATTGRSLTRLRMRRLISGAGWTPVERDGIHRPIAVHTKEPVMAMIPYLNFEPFYWHLDTDPFRLIPMPPRHMGAMAMEGKVDAGPLSLMDWFDLEKDFDPLEFGVAVKNRARSVILYSGRPPLSLDRRHIGITDETSTSVCLMRLLLRRRFGVLPMLERFSPARGTGAVSSTRFSRFDAVLLIGDRALMDTAEFRQFFPFRLDLGQLWYETTGLPFVFARWAIRRSLGPEVREKLINALERSLRTYETRKSVFGMRHGRCLGLTGESVREYFDGFQFRLGPMERKAMTTFRRMYWEEFADEPERP